MGIAFFVAATGQNIGKTTTCLGLLSGLKKRFSSVGFFKPVGQEHVQTESGIRVDKDVVLFKTHFHLNDPYQEMSPVLFPRGFTRDYLDGKIHSEELIHKIIHSFQSLQKRSKAIIVEGTGHTGVGSIVNLNNAKVASLLKLPVLLIASGGLGSSFDELNLNYTQCKQMKVPVAGVILNRVLDEKREMVIHYMKKALKPWNVPLLGAIPYDAFLSTPTMADFEALFQTELLTAKEYRLRHFLDLRLIASSEEMTPSSITPNQLIITPADREEIILTLLTRFWDAKILHPHQDPAIGIILTGKTKPNQRIIEQIQKAQIPMLHAELSCFITMKMIHTYTTKIRTEDRAKIEEAIQVVEEHIDFDTLLETVSHHSINA